MNNSLPKEMEFKKLEQIANDWVEEYGGYIAEISFFCSIETSGLNAKEYQYCIDFVLCDPPRIEPVSRFSSGFIAKEAGVMSVRLLGLMPEQTDSELRDEMRSNRFDTAITPQQKKEMEFLRQWKIDIRWETDQPDPSYIPESKQILYSRPKNQPSKQIEFSPEDYERLKRLPSFNLEECIGLMLGMPYEQNMIAIQKGELDIEIASQVLKKNSEYTELLSRSFYDGELKSKDNSLDSTLADPTFKPQVFFEWAKKKGFEIPIGNPIKTDDMKVEVLNHALSVSKNNSASTGPKKAEIDPEEKISRVLTKGWEPEHPIERLSKQREIAIWNSWIQPIVNLHYNGVFGYKYFKEPENLNHDDLEAMWEQHIAPFICSNLPQWIKYPQSFTQAELESLIGENIWEPDLFVSEILLPLKAGISPELVKPFLKCLNNTMATGSLPVFLAYIGQRRDVEITLEWATEGDFPKDRMTQQKELAVWNQWIKPIVDKHFNGRIEYKFYKEPEVITPDQVDAVMRKMIAPFVFKYEHGPFPTDDFLKEIVDRLRAGFHEYEGVDLKELFNDFLSWAIYEGLLPAFIAYINQVRDKNTEPVGKQDQIEYQKKEKLRAPQKDKLKVQVFAKKTWDKYPELTVIDVARHPNFSAEGFLNRNTYKERTLRNWVSEVAPDGKNDPGRLPNAEQEKREKTCKKLGIQIN